MHEDSQAKGIGIKYSGIKFYHRYLPFFNYAELGENVVRTSARNNIHT